MLKRIFGSKKMPALSFCILLIFCFTLVVLFSSLLGGKAPPQAQFRYVIGENVVDFGGSLWEYQGNYRLEVGQLTPDMKLLSVFICNEERKVAFIHEELIPETTPGDYFKLIEPSPQLKAQLSRGISILLMPDDDWCNVTVADPPVHSASGAGILLCCMMLYCGD